MNKTMIIEGMMCAHCTGRVEKALAAIEGVAAVEMNLEGKSATLTLNADVSNDVLTAAVTEAGYEVVEIRVKADHTQVQRLLKTARGQLDGILKMVEEDRYCLDVSNQLMATQSILKKANRVVLKAHMECCVREAIESGSPEEKMAELAALLDKLAD